MGLYLLVFMGSQAIGAFAWGLLAGPLGYAGALALTDGTAPVVEHLLPPRLHPNHPTSMPPGDLQASS